MSDHRRDRCCRLRMLPTEKDAGGILRNKQRDGEYHEHVS